MGRWTRWTLGFVTWLAIGCEGRRSELAEVHPPEAVSPVAVTAEAQEETDEVARLGARVAELEAELARCGCGAEPSEDPQATQTAVVPARANVPEPTEATATSAPGDTEGTGATGAGTEARSRPAGRSRTILGTLLGDEEEAERQLRRVRRETPADGERIELPNPASILLGE